MTYLGVLADITEGSFKTHKGAFGSGKNGNRCRSESTWLEYSHGPVPHLS
jgi:hypothetical protein